MELTDQERKALVGWLAVVHGGKETNKKLNIRNGGKLPPSLQAAVNYLRMIFGELILSNQDCFGSEEGYEELLKMIPDSRVVETLRTKWEANPSRTSEEKWADLHRSLSSQRNLNILEDIIIQYTYPRLDAEVSKHRNHLLKAPFCIHPKTGRVCIPLDLESIDKFDPESVPTLGQLLQELDTIGVSMDQDQARGTHSDWEKTSLKPYIDLMEKHALGLMEDVRREKHKADTTW
jgi:DNA primase small subunit